MLRTVWLLFAALGTALLPVAPAVGQAAPMDVTACAASVARPSCAGTGSLPCHEQPVRESPACLPCCVTCCFAIVQATETPTIPPGLVGRFEHVVEKAAARAEPPPLPPPRRAGASA